jgi:hypothetical protein
MVYINLNLQSFTQEFSTLSTGFSTGENSKNREKSRLFRRSMKKTPQLFTEMWSNFG